MFSSNCHTSSLVQSYLLLGGLLPLAWCPMTADTGASNQCTLSWLELPLKSNKPVQTQVTKIHEEEWSFIPVGGPLPVAQQSVTAFGAAANLVHPATGYSIARSLREAPNFAEEVATLLKKRQAVGDTAEGVWEALWPPEKRRQVCCSCCARASDCVCGDVLQCMCASVSILTCGSLDSI